MSSRRKLSSARTCAILALLPLAALALVPGDVRAQGTPSKTGQTQPVPAPAPASTSTPAPRQSATPQPSATPPHGGAGGDGGRQHQATLVIEEVAASTEPPPLAPVGDERAAIGETIRSHTDDVRDCYLKRLAERPTLQGRMVARFDIGPSGKVIGATAEGIADTQLVSCVVRVVRQWEFDKPASGGKLRVAYPFVFKAIAADSR